MSANWIFLQKQKDFFSKKASFAVKNGYIYVYLCPFLFFSIFSYLSLFISFQQILNLQKKMKEGREREREGKIKGEKKRLKRKNYEVITDRAFKQIYKF